tara:strand:+ start:393 stop:1124 length:732 start_codon:yes stop_codon:yes gene_type:complete
MIKFFRKTRQNLLTEGKTEKYLKYAIGEILLVVIGIIIALQLNNWNETRKKQNLKNEYLVSLKNDYRKDTVQLSDRIYQNKKRLKVLMHIYPDSLSTSVTKPEEFISLFKNKFGKGLRVINTYNTNSFNLLISSGNIDLLDKQFRESIMELNRLQVFENQVSLGNRDYFFRFMSNYFLKYPAETPFNSINQILWNGIETNELPKDLMAYFGQERYTIERYLELSRDVLLQTELVLKLLEDLEN